MTTYSNRLTFYETFTDRDLLHDQQQGINDGRQNRPDYADRDFSPYEWSLVKRADTDLSDLMQEYHANRARLEQERDTRQRWLMSYSSRRQNLMNDRKSRLDRLNLNEGADSKTHSHPGNVFKGLDAELKVRSANIKRPLRNYVGTWPYRILFFILAMAEFPINLPAVETVFQEAPLLAGFIALVLGFLLIFFAHTLGRFARQYRSYLESDRVSPEDAIGKKRWRWPTAGTIIFFIATILLLAMSAGIIYYVYELRMTYLSTPGNQLTGTGVQGFSPGAGYGGGYNSSGYFFLFINMAIYLTGLTISWLHHDPDPDYQKLCDEHKKARLALEEVESDFAAKALAIQAESDAEIGSLAREAETMDSEARNAAVALENLNTKRRSTVELILSVMGWRILAYQTANALTRSKRPPLYFGGARVGDAQEALREKHLKDPPITTHPTPWLPYPFCEDKPQASSAAGINGSHNYNYHDVVLEVKRSGEPPAPSASPMPQPPFSMHPPPFSTRPPSPFDATGRTAEPGATEPPKGDKPADET